jgi:spermidine dehydrogenase
MKPLPPTGPTSVTLGVDEKIQREDHLLGGLSAEDWDGYTGVGDYSRSNGNTHAVMSAGHGIRDGLYSALLNESSAPEETYDCVVVGGGISGLAAAQTFIQKAPGRTCLILENHAIFGGEARRNEFDVNGQRVMTAQGSAMFFPPLPGSSLLAFYESMGLGGKALEYQQLEGAARNLQVVQTLSADHGPQLGMYFGKLFGHPEGIWVTDPWGKRLQGTPFPEDVKRQLLGKAKPANVWTPKPKEYGDAVLRDLDSMTQEEVMMRRDGLTRETIRKYMPYAAGAAGASADAISGAADYVPDIQFPWDNSNGVQMFPGGNTDIARFQLKALIPDALPGPRTLQGVSHAKINFDALDRPHQNLKVRLNATVFAVKHDGDADAASSATITYLLNGKPYRVRAKSVVMSGGWPTWRTILDLPQAHREAYGQFYRMPCLIANVCLTNWRFLAKQGISECAWYEGLGRFFVIRRQAVFGPGGAKLSPDSPVPVSIKILYTEPGLPLEQQARRGRMKMLSTPFSEYERSLREQFQEMFGRWGFDARKDIAGIILNRWGHAYLCAQPGFFFGKDGKPAPREILRRAPFNRIAFANSDLSGIMDHRASIAEAQRAVEQLLL